MNGPDGSGKTVLPHGGDFIEFGLIKFGVGYDGAYGRVRIGGAVQRVGEECLVEGEFAVVKGFAVPCSHSGQFFAGLEVINVAHGVDGDHCSDFQITELHGVNTEPGVHNPVRLHKFADGRSCPGAGVALLRTVEFRILTGFFRHFLIGAHVSGDKRQVKYAGLAHQRNVYVSHGKTNALFSQIFHNTSGGVKSECASAAQKDGVYHVRSGGRIQKLGLSGSRASASDIHSGGHTVFAYNNGASRGMLQILGVSYFYVLDFAYIYFPERVFHP